MNQHPVSIYRRLGVEPVVNCGSSRSFYGSSVMSDPVREAIVSASLDYVIMEELAEAIGQRLADLTGAGWGTVTAGSSGGLALAAAACVAANDPLRMLRMPQSFHGEQRVVLTPKGQRFAYDQAIRLVGAVIVEVGSLEELHAALRERHVVAISIFGERDAGAPVRFDDILPVAREAGVPVLVDAASEPLGRPESWTARGADLVVYSIGKLIRGPAAAGLLLGRRDLVRAAWFNGPPHQGFARAMKIGKEEMVGAIAAVEYWFSRDHEAERRGWRRRLEVIRDRLRPINTLRLDLSELAGGVPRLKVDWSQCQPGLSFLELRAELLARRPRILIDDYGGSDSSTMLNPFALRDGEEVLVAEALHEAFSAARPVISPLPVTDADVSGEWVAELDFANGAVRHRLQLQRRGDRLSGAHLAPGSRAEASGAMKAGGFEFQAFHMVEGNTVSYRFVAQECSATRIAGFVELGAAASHTRGPTTFGQFGTVRFHAAPVSEGVSPPRG